MKSLEALDCQYLDMYLIHWPGVQKLKREDPNNAELRKESWKALEKLYKKGYSFNTQLRELIGFWFDE